MSTGLPILPMQLVQITARPQTSKFYPERLLIKDAAHWKIDAIRVGNQASALVQHLPGEMFAPDAVGRFPGCGEIQIPQGGELIVQVTYTGRAKSGLPFEACVFGSDGQPLASTANRGVGKKIATVMSSDAIPFNKSVKLSTDPMEHDAWPCRLVIKGASDWVVNDVRVGEVSIFVQSGDVPGSLFAEDFKGGASAICMGHLAAGDKFSVVARYVGTSDAELVYELYGTNVESEAADLAIASILPMSTGVSIFPTHSAQITGRCPLRGVHGRGIGIDQGFLSERIIVERATDWIFNEIKIGRLSQFAHSGDVPGMAFSPETLGGQVSFAVARAGLDVAFVTTYNGPREDGDTFVGGILGSLVDLADGDTAPGHERILTIRDLNRSPARGSR
jgi:hypothetical protein